MSKSPLEKIIGKQSKIQFKDGYVLYGVVEKANRTGIIFSTTTSTTYISWDLIAKIKPR